MSSVSKTLSALVEELDRLVDAKVSAAVRTKAVSLELEAARQEESRITQLLSETIKELRRRGASDCKSADNAAKA